MGTILNGQVDVFRTIVAAVAKNKNLQLVLSIGDQTRSEADRTGSEQCHHRKAGAAIGVAETDHGLYHPCRAKHRARIFGSRRSAISHPDNL